MIPVELLANVISSGEATRNPLNNFVNWVIYFYKYKSLISGFKAKKTFGQRFLRTLFFFRI
ncbi:hypothetical protein DRQ36_06080 [bacterium]|nr:MAG: hypothetical protein DRQ36_06080 [bacterium]